MRRVMLSCFLLLGLGLSACASPEPTAEPVSAPPEQPAEQPTEAPTAPPLEPPEEMAPSSEINPADVTGDIVIAGSSTVFPLSEAVAEVFRDEGYEGNISIDSIGSGAGFERFCVAGESDISNASRAIKDSERESCEAIGRDPIEVRVGTDALAVVVNPENDFASELTLEELATVFSTAETWADVNPDWPAEPIQRFIPGTDSGTFDYFVETVFEEDPEPILSASDTQMSEDDNVLVRGVAESPHGVGFFGYAYYQQNEDDLATVAIDSIPPTDETARDGSYPISRPLFMYTDAGVIAEKPQVGQFILYYLDMVDDVITDVGYFPATDEEIAAARDAVLAAQ